MRIRETEPVRKGWGGVLVAGLMATSVATARPAAADEWWPWSGILPEEISCAALGLPGRAGAWPLPLYSPDVGIGLLTMPPVPPDVAARLPRRIELRTDKGGFNEVWQYALLDNNLYIKAVAGESGWRIPPVPNCLRGQITGISVDGSRLMATGPEGWIYTLESADWTPELWWWTKRFGAPIWLDPSGTRVRPGSQAWSLSWLNPRYVQVLPFRHDGRWTDASGHEVPVGGAGVTTVYVLSPGGDRIAILDPWLPAGDPLHPEISELADDYSYELPGPLNGRFRAINLSSSGSTTFVINEYGDMFTRLWDFDISGADTLFFSYSYEDQSAFDAAPNNFEHEFSRFPQLRPPFNRYADIQLPAPDWIRQPKISGEITSTISIHQTGAHSHERELRVEGRDGEGRTGFWHKPIDPNADWAFTVTDQPQQADTLDNRSGDTSHLTMSPPTGVDYGYRDAEGWTVAIRDFDYAGDRITLRLCDAGGACTDVAGHLASDTRMSWQREGLSDMPRKYHGIVSVTAEEMTSLEQRAPRLHALVDRLVGEGRMRNITAEATTSSLSLRTSDGEEIVMTRSG
ncbi:hypothetical protein ABZ319_37605 [Nocardia sp. NPDC005978]|uniref:hypothetical protein n=1 Tax=Nocardia sp. NPDC005978 TaxID=3156725 RepID=UPI0033BB6202